MEVKRGDVFIVDFDPAQGSEQAGTRPAVVVQNDVGNRYSPTTIVIVVTAAAQKNYPLLVPLKAVPSTNPALGKIWSPFLVGRETSRNLLIQSAKRGHLSTAVYLWRNKCKGHSDSCFCSLVTAGLFCYRGQGFSYRWDRKAD